MKKLIIILSILACRNLYAQPKFVSATSQGWAGGVCCRTGINYVITLSGTKKEMENLKIKSVCIGSMEFSNSVIIQPQYTRDDKLAYMVIHCSYSHDTQDENPLSEGHKEITVFCNELCVKYTLSKKEGAIKITKVEELEFLAYP